MPERRKRKMSSCPMETLFLFTLKTEQIKIPSICGGLNSKKSKTHDSLDSEYSLKLDVTERLTSIILRSVHNLMSDV